jgi:NADH-quinone oxidoreductase subunit C
VSDETTPAAGEEAVADTPAIESGDVAAIEVADVHAAVTPLAEAFPQASYEDRGAETMAMLDRDDLVAFVSAARDAGFTMFSDLCAVDYLRRNPRFEVVVNLISMGHLHRLIIRVGVPGTDPVCPSIAGVFPGANFYEREAFDLFGIDFAGHPELTRILLPDDWEGHPLRKDAQVGSVPVQFKEAHKAT